MFVIQVSESRWECFWNDSKWGVPRSMAIRSSRVTIETPGKPTLVIVKIPLPN